MNTNHGGSRKNSGRKVRLNLRFEPGPAGTIYQLTKILGAQSGNRELTEEQVLAGLAENKLEEIYRVYEEAEITAEGL